MIDGSTNEVSDMCSQEIDHAHINGGGMLFNATFNNISAISVEEAGVPGRRKPPTCCKSLTNFIT